MAEIETVAARWILRREEGDWAASDQQDLDAWLAQSFRHKAIYWRLEHGWRQTDRLAALASAPLPAQPWRNRWRGAIPGAVAASLLLAVLLAAPALRYGRPAAPPSLEAFNTPRGGHKIVALPDGSKIEMNTASAVRATNFTGPREVWLDHGEAFFNVEHIADRPFVVHAGRATVTVLGTKFSVKRIGGTVTVSVLQGRVRVDNAGDGGRPTLVAAGGTAIATDKSILLAPQSPQRVEDALAWRQGMLNFDQATLAEAAAEFSRYRTKPLVVGDADAAQVRISGSFEATNADAFVRLLHDAYGLHVSEESDATKISD